MRTLTLLELLVEWENLKQTDFIVVWLPAPGTEARTGEEWARNWQRGCCNSGPYTHGIVDDIKRSTRLECEIHTDPALHYGWSEVTRACFTCKRPLREHLTAKQFAEISAQIEADLA